MSLKNTCRTCLHTGGIMVPMFQINLTDAESPAVGIVDLLKMFTKILIFPNDGFPQQMCITCLEDIKRVYEFKVKCERSERSLTTMFQRPMLLVPITGVANNSSILRTVLMNNDKVPPVAVTNENVTTVLPSGSNLFANTNKKIGIKNKTSVMKKVPRKKILETVKNTTNTPQTDDLNASHKTLVKIAPKFSPIGLPNGNLIPIMPFNSGPNFGSPAILPPIPFDPSALIPPSNFQVVSLSNLIPMGNLIPNTNSVELPKKFTSPVKENVNSGSLQAEISTGPAIKEAVVENVKNDHDYLANVTIDDSNEAGGTTDTADENGDVKDFQCPACSVISMNVKLLKKHLIAEHTKEKTCLICNRIRINHTSMIRHMTLAHMAKKHVCTECNKRFIGRASYARHMKRYFGKSKHECSVCEKKFCVEGEYQRHRRRHLPPSEPIVCQICNTQFSTKKYLWKHRKEQHSKGTFDCNLCRKTFSNRHQLSGHRWRIHTGNVPVKCEVCQKTYPRLYNLRGHQRRCHSGRTYSLRCPMCPRKFMHKSDRRSHIQKVHSDKGDINERRCDICFKVMGSKFNLHGHRRTHLNLRPFKCEICHRQFKTKHSLKTHLIFHSAERPMKCEYCSLSFKTVANLKQHKKALHKIEFQREIEEKEAAKKAQEENDLIEEELVQATCEQRRHAVRPEHLDSVLPAAK